MTNASIVGELKRVKQGLIQRAPRWDALDKSLKDAATIADAQTKSISKKMGGSYILSHPLNLDQMSKVSFVVAEINGLSAAQFMGMATSPIMHGFFWFQAIFIASHGRGQNPYDLVQSQFAVGGGPNYFQDMAIPSLNAQKIGREFDRLIKVIEAEKTALSEPDAEKAISAMLLAPIFFPPTQIPTVEAIEVQIEWSQWQALMDDIAENIYADSLAAKVYENPPKTNLDVLFDRLNALVMTAYKFGIKLVGYPEMSNLENLRRGLERQTITRANFAKGVPNYEMSVTVNFPPKVMNYVRAHGFEGTQKVYLSNQRMTFAEANL